MYGWHGLVAVVWLIQCAVERKMAGIEGTVLGLLAMIGGQKVVNKFAAPDGTPQG